MRVVRVAIIWYRVAAQRIGPHTRGMAANVKRVCGLGWGCFVVAGSAAVIRSVRAAVVEVSPRVVVVIVVKIGGRVRWVV